MAGFGAVFRALVVKRAIGTVSTDVLAVESKAWMIKWANQVIRVMKKYPASQQDIVKRMNEENRLAGRQHFISDTSAMQGLYKRTNRLRDAWEPPKYLWQATGWRVRIVNNVTNPRSGRGYAKYVHGKEGEQQDWAEDADWPRLDEVMKEHWPAYMTGLRSVYSRWARGGK